MSRRATRRGEPRGPGRRRSLLSAAGAFAVAMMIGTAVTVSYGLATGFDRASERAGLADLTVRFDPSTRAEIAARIDGLANVAARSLRLERTDLALFALGDEAPDGRAELLTRRSAIQVLDGGPRGYEIVAGRDVGGRPGEVVIEQGAAREFELEPGDDLGVDTLGLLRVTGIAIAPDDVGYPLASRARAWIAPGWVPSSFTGGRERVNVALLWARDEEQLAPLLAQARTLSFGLGDPRFATEGAVRGLVSRAVGLVIALLIAFSVVALGTAAVALAASARADTQRRLPAIGVMRAVGISRAGVTARQTGAALGLAVPAATAGLAAGAALVYGPNARLLEILSRLPPGGALLAPLAGALLVVVAIIALSTLWPLWRAAGQPPATLLRGAEISAPPRRLPLPGGPLGLGARLALARRARTVATALVVAAAAAVVMLMLALGSFLDGLANDPGAIGKRFALSADLPVERLDEVERIPGVEDAAPRYELTAASSFNLGQTITVVGYPGDHTRFEAPPLSSGRRIERRGEAEVGRGLADALGLSPGATVAPLLSSGEELRLKVVGIVDAIDAEGRIAYVRAGDLPAGSARPQLAIKLDPGADEGAVARRLVRLGASPKDAAGVSSRDQTFLGTLAGVLRVVGGVNGLIALYLLAAALTVTALERRLAIAVLRSSGAGRGTITAVMLGAALVVVGIALPAAIALQSLLLGPVVAGLAADYASLAVTPTAPQLLAVGAGLVLLSGLAAVLVARSSVRTPIAAALRSE
ncbi:MAG: FtsX-like permease family protein [Thermoleophilaceae bacterium]